jgi:hypothetical protein
LIATASGIRPVLLQNKQVDQANANNARLLPADRRGPPSPASLIAHALSRCTTERIANCSCVYFVTPAKAGPELAPGLNRGQPLQSQDRILLPLLSKPLVCHQLLQERFSPSALPCRSGAVARRPLPRMTAE